MAEYALSELRVRTRIPVEQRDVMDGKNWAPGDWDVLLTGPAKVLMPDGRPLCVYLPGAMRKFSEDPAFYDIFAAMGKSGSTGNRGKAGASPALPAGTQKRLYSLSVRSAIIGSFDPSGIYKTCRKTVWTAEHTKEWEAAFPALQHVAHYLREYVPDRYRAQMEEVSKTRQEWMIPGTPFTTITVNDTYATGVHVDKGDLDKGFSSIWCIRRGDYSGGQLGFPEYRVAVDLHDGDLILMDAHQYHSNAKISCVHGELWEPCRSCAAQRISIVSYYRTKMTSCQSPEDELAKAKARREIQIPASLSSALAEPAP